MLVYGVQTFRTLRVHWTLHELNIPYAIESIESRTGQTQTIKYTQINPGQKIPYLRDGNFGISESAAICIYLAKKYRNKQLIPAKDLTKQAKFFQNGSRLHSFIL